MSSTSQPKDLTAVDPPQITQHTSPRWLKLSNLRSASPAEVALLNNQQYLLSVLQNIMRSQEAMVIQVDKLTNMMKGTSSRQSSAQTEESLEDIDNDGESDRGDNDKQKGDSTKAFNRGPFKYVDDESETALKTIISRQNSFIYRFFRQYAKEKKVHLYKSVCNGSTRLGLEFHAACITAAKVANEDEVAALLARLRERDITSLFLSAAQRVRGEQNEGNEDDEDGEEEAENDDEDEDVVEFHMRKRARRGPTI